MPHAGTTLGVSSHTRVTSFPRSLVWPAILGPGAGRIRISPAYGSHSCPALCFGRYPQEYGAYGLQQFGEASDWFHGFAPVEYYCLFLAVSQEDPRDDRVLRGLLLESAEEEGTFRRVGQIFFRGRCALKMRYQLRPGETDEHVAWERLWELVAPYWGEVETDVEMAREPTGPVPVDIQAEGPSTLYKFDGHVADDPSFLKLEPQVITLV